MSEIFSCQKQAKAATSLNFNQLPIESVFFCYFEIFLQGVQKHNQETHQPTINNKT